jgi:UDP-3-O-[3-hydroxymyristoyl] N-acetylglucosamine deacetylase
MYHRQTLASPVRLEGIGLHSGEPVKVRLVPAEPSTGVVFVRTDLDGARVPATVEYSGPSFYATVLEKDGVKISTIEHLMAALYALQIDDVLVEMDRPEAPIMDGSSRPFVEALERAGTVESDVPREFITLTRSVTVEDGDKRISAHPGEEFRISYAIDFEHPMLGYQELSVGLWRSGAFANKLASARTFTFEVEVERLRENGLALGGSLDNALVLAEDRLLNLELRFEDEFVRHKMLDLTGDLSLLGRPLLAHVVAYRAGHDLHAKLARKIWESRDSWYLAPWTGPSPDLDPAAEG